MFKIRYLPLHKAAECILLDHVQLCHGFFLHHMICCKVLHRNAITKCNNEKHMQIDYSKAVNRGNDASKQ